MKHKVLLLLLAVAASVGTMTAEVYNGTCGDNLTWSLNTQDSTLTIEGTGEMDNYDRNMVYSYYMTPWYDYKDYIKTISLPSGITSIGDGAFYDCGNLISVTIPNSVTSIGDHAFFNCSGLTSITIPNSVTSIGDYAFHSCTGLTSVTIPESVTSIGDYAFLFCSRLTSITIPNSVTSIGSMAFGAIPNVVYNGTATGSPWGAKTINGYVDGYLVYSDATKTTLTACSSAAQGDIVIPHSVTSIGEGAFSYCSSLTSVTIPNSVTSIGRYAFGNVPNIVYNGTATGSPWGARTINGYIDGNLVYSDATKTTLTACFPTAQGDIVIPNSVTSIGENAFSDCIGLTSITIPNSVTSIGYSAFFGCNSLTSITIPESVTSIGDYAFTYCSGMTSVTIPESVTSIGDYAFYNCRLTDIVLPSNLETIGEWAFALNAIKTITCYSQLPPSVHGDDGDYDSFRGSLTDDVIIYVPADYLNTYKAHDFWGQYDIRPIEATPTPTDDIQVTSDENTANIIWPAVDGAATYLLIIIDQQGNVICTLVFNANGQLMRIAFGAPRSQAVEQTPAEGFSFIVTGLQNGTTYQFTLDALDEEGNIIDRRDGEFTTAAVATGLDDISTTDTPTAAQKVIMNGTLYILTPDGIIFNAKGARVK